MLIIGSIDFFEGLDEPAPAGTPPPMSPADLEKLLDDDPTNDPPR